MSKESMSVEEFIRAYGKLFSKPEVERLIGMPDKTLQRVVDGRNVPEKYRMELIGFFKTLGEKIAIK